MNDSPREITSRDLAAMIGRSQATTRRAVTRAGIRPVRYEKGPTRRPEAVYSGPDIEEFIRARTTKGETRNAGTTATGMGRPRNIRRYPPRVENGKPCGPGDDHRDR